LGIFCTVRCKEIQITRQTGLKNWPIVVEYKAFIEVEINGRVSKEVYIRIARTCKEHGLNKELSLWTKWFERPYDYFKVRMKAYNIAKELSSVATVQIQKNCGFCDHCYFRLEEYLEAIQQNSHMT